jgi:fatty acid desaturase
MTELAARDWGMQQILTSANWGGAVGNFFTGGLNLQVEHHLFPAISFAHYPAIAAIVEDECKRRGVQYAKYDTLPEVRSTACMAWHAQHAQQGWGASVCACRAARHHSFAARADAG